MGARPATKALAHPLVVVALAAAAAASSAVALSLLKGERYTARAVVRFESPCTALARPCAPRGFERWRRAAVGSLRPLVLREIGRDVLPLFGSDATPTDVLHVVSASARRGVVAVRATSPRPAFAAEVANAYAEAYAANRRRILTASLEKRLAEREARLAAEGSSAGSEQLRAELDRLRTILASLERGNPTVAVRAEPPENPVGEPLGARALAGALLGLLLAAAVTWFQRRGEVATPGVLKGTA